MPDGSLLCDRSIRERTPAEAAEAAAQRGLQLQRDLDIRAAITAFEVRITALTCVFVQGTRFSLCLTQAATALGSCQMQAASAGSLVRMHTLQQGFICCDCRRLISCCRAMRCTCHCCPSSGATSPSSQARQRLRPRAVLRRA